MPMMSKNPKKEPDLVSIAKQERYKIGHPTTLVSKKQEFLEEETLCDTKISKKPLPLR